jgi:hypothetical protein
MPRDDRTLLDVRAHYVRRGPVGVVLDDEDEGVTLLAAVGHTLNRLGQRVIVVGLLGLSRR